MGGEWIDWCLRHFFSFLLFVCLIVPRDSLFYSFMMVYFRVYYVTCSSSSPTLKPTKLFITYPQIILFKNIKQNLILFDLIWLKISIHVCMYVTERCKDFGVAPPPPSRLFLSRPNSYHFESSLSYFFR